MGKGITAYSLRITDFESYIRFRGSIFVSFQFQCKPCSIDIRQKTFWYNMSPKFFRPCYPRFHFQEI